MKKTSKDAYTATKHVLKFHVSNDEILEIKKKKRQRHLKYQGLKKLITEQAEG